ncbi:hypothetical protein FAX13_08470 [Ligilactobacillus animalis]|nr:hypothetical protein FAX13_08470 [Ligilactobacillus animalis]
MKKVVYWIIAILLVLLLPWYIGIPGAVIAYLIYRSRKNAARKVPQPSIQELERQRVMQRNRAIINGYLTDRAKFAKNVKRRFDYNNDDIEKWRTSVDQYFAQANAVMVAITNNPTLRYIDPKYKLQSYFDDIAVKILNDPPKIFTFEGMVVNILPEMNKTLSYYNRIYDNNLIANDPEVQKTLSSTKAQIEGFAQKIQAEYKRVLMGQVADMQSQTALGGAMVSDVVQNTATMPKKEMPQVDSKNDIEDMLK